ncbi:glycosyltransferase family 2 protein [Flavobacterium sp.]|uniref:glycosyltransferase family 2 protein n=1 Tax=Flavobacterium sp. TaxID=239 RepID=UPI0028BD297C|nr:glycosyltransferase [Flavobacterium sp.]
MKEFKEYIASNGETLLYVGNPNLEMLNDLARGAGDLWHSSFEQGFKNAFSDIVYFSAVFFWYGNDFDGLDECVSWRINPEAFVVRKSVWQSVGGFDDDYKNPILKAFDFGYNLLKNSGGIPFYVKGLFSNSTSLPIKISVLDRHVFYRKNFKAEHGIYMCLRKGFWKINEWDAFFKAKKRFATRKSCPIVAPRELRPIEGKPTVSYVIPTMLRQEFTLTLLNDLKNQSYLPSQVVVVDATPEDKRNESLYNPEDYPFEVVFKWQTTKGSCRARNEAIDLCTGDYIIFGDDDVRFHADFVENHIRFLQTYSADACNGLDLMADHLKQDLNDLKSKLDKLSDSRWRAGASNNFSNANSCVKRARVIELGGNDVNYDGGYGEDGDFGISLTKIGATVLFNPFSANLHLKPPVGGYRFWGSQAKIMGKKRKKQPWELDSPVKWVRPVPSPTVMYQLYKQFTPQQRTEYKYKYFFRFLTKGNKWQIPVKLFRLPYKLLQFNKSEFYAKKLLALGKRTA